MAISDRSREKEAKSSELEQLPVVNENQSSFPTTKNKRIQYP